MARTFDIELDRSAKVIKLKLHILICAVLGSMILAYVFKPNQPDMPEGFDKCPNPIEVPSHGVFTFWYCPDTHQTWKPAWERWDKPARFEQKNIERFELEIKRVMK